MFAITPLTANYAEVEIDRRSGKLKLQNTTNAPTEQYRQPAHKLLSTETQSGMLPLLCSPIQNFVPTYPRTLGMMKPLESEMNPNSR